MNKYTNNRVCWQHQWSYSMCQNYRMNAWSPFRAFWSGWDSHAHQNYTELLHLPSQSRKIPPPGSCEPLWELCLLTKNGKIEQNAYISIPIFRNNTYGLKQCYIASMLDLKSAKTGQKQFDRKWMPFCFCRSPAVKCPMLCPTRVCQVSKKLEKDMQKSRQVAEIRKFGTVFGKVWPRVISC